MRFVAVLFLALLSRAVPIAAQAKPLQDLEAYITRGMAQWQIPGLAIGVVRNDSVVMLKGYGVKRLGSREPVDERTLFAIGSSSKAFTALGVAMLVDEGKVRWDDPATKYLPGFQLYDPYVTRELTVRDLLSHRSGLARGDLVWYAQNISRDSVLHQVRYLEPSWSLRSQFGYQNLMYLAAGQLTARVSGRSWDQVMQDRILTPLSMRGSNTSVSRLKGQTNVAMPHEEVDDTVRVVPWKNIDNVAPAGSINSNAADMVQWVRFQLAGGKVSGKPLLSAGAFDETHTPHTIIPLKGVWGVTMPEAHLAAYGLGWFLHDYRGRKIVEHGGNIDGMHALVALMPEEKTGLVVLTNLGTNFLTYALMYRIFDAYMKQPRKDWSAQMRKGLEGLRAQGKAEEKNREGQRIAGTSPSLKPEQYAGTYVDTMYGEARVRADGGKLVLQYGSLIGDLEHWHHDTFRSHWRQRHQGKAFVTFALDVDSKVGELKVADLADFKRKPEAPDTTPAVQLAAADLPKYTGSFAADSLPVTAEVQVVGGQLKLTVAGQPPYTLVPVSPTRFRLTGPAEMPAGFFLDYTMKGGRVERVTLVQPAPQPVVTLLPQRGARR
ncbi:MAG: serine hydrolase [Gemmatimonadales bacterium]|nr:serine hydrolase [Gemmatimonadales bacterium]MBA3554403.1 serine hydrolase [Gemmatimonadales bacterium]